MYKVAHQLKPNFMMLGMKEQQNMATRLEKIAKYDNENKEDVPMLIHQIIMDTEMALPILQEKIA